MYGQCEIGGDYIYNTQSKPTYTAGGNFSMRHPSENFHPIAYLIKFVKSDLQECEKRGKE